MLDAYQQPVRRQARTSYTYGIVASGAGLATLLIGIVVTAAVSSDTARITSGTLSAFGTATAGYIARTFLRMYEKAQDQLNFYFREPLVTSYLLTAERLAAGLEGAASDAARSVMISELAKAAGAEISKLTASASGSDGS